MSAGACRSDRIRRSGARISQRRSISNGDGRGGAIAQTAGAGRRDVTEAKNAPVNEDRTSESIGAGKDECTRTRLDESQGRRATDTRIHRDGAGTVMIEDEVRGGSWRVVSQEAGGTVDVPVGRAVDEDGARGGSCAPAQLHVERRKIKDLRCARRGTKLERADRGISGGLVLASGQDIAGAHGSSAGGREGGRR